MHPAIDLATALRAELGARDWSHDMLRAKLTVKVPKTTLNTYLKGLAPFDPAVLLSVIEAMEAEGPFYVPWLADPIVIQDLIAQLTMGAVKKGAPGRRSVRRIKTIDAEYSRTDSIYLGMRVPPEAWTAFEECVSGLRLKPWNAKDHAPWWKGVRHPGGAVRVAWSTPVADVDHCRVIVESTDAGEGWKVARLLHHAFSTRTRVARIDIALDYDIPIRSIFLVRKRAHYRRIESAEGKVTIYSGKRDSGLMVTLYEKVIAGRWMTRIEAVHKPKSPVLWDRVGAMKNPFRTIEVLSAYTPHLSLHEVDLIRRSQAFGIEWVLKSLSVKDRSVLTAAVSKARAARPFTAPSEEFGGRTLKPFAGLVSPRWSWLHEHLQMQLAWDPDDPIVKRAVRLRRAWEA